jgi:hypothetical protein
VGIVRKGTGSRVNITPDGPKAKCARVVYAEGCEVIGPGYTNLSYCVR